MVTPVQSTYTFEFKYDPDHHLFSWAILSTLSHDLYHCIMHFLPCYYQRAFDNSCSHSRMQVMTPRFSDEPVIDIAATKVSRVSTSVNSALIYAAMPTLLKSMGLLGLAITAVSASALPETPSTLVKRSAFNDCFRKPKPSFAPKEQNRVTARRH